MKKLPLCTLFSGAVFAIAGTIALLKLAPRPDPFPLFFPLMWDLIMVGIGAGIVLRCDCARKAGVAWGIFCILASLGVGAAAFDWLLPQQAEPMAPQRMFFMIVSVGFGVAFGVWQMFALNSSTVRAWTHHDGHHDANGDDSHPHHQPHHS